MATIFRNSNLFCTNCGTEKVLVYPMTISETTKLISNFEDAHKDCEQTWVEPEADQTQSIQDRALWWNANGEKGMSSNTMWNCFMDAKKFPINYPHDPDDFKRCWKLLGVIPEWRKEMHKLKPLCRQWSNLVDNWDELTDMYELNCLNDWKTSKKIGMYELMQKLTR